MKNLILTTIALFFCLFSYSQSLDIGVRIQKTHKMYWENGFSIKYSFATFKPHNFELGVDYLTSRLGSAYNSNAIKQDNYLANATWKFGDSTKVFKIYTRVNLGLLVADFEEPFFDELPNKAFLLSPEVGCVYSFTKLPMKLGVGLGYYIDVQKEGKTPGTFQPLYYHFNVSYPIKIKK